MIITDKFFENKVKVLLALLLPAFILYLKSLSFEFTSMDEQWLIVQNAEQLKSWTAVSDAFTKSITGLYYRPLLLTSIFLDFQIGKLSPVIYHFTNLALHLLTVFLLFRFLLHNKASKQAALFLSVLFSVHPLMLHAVAWIPGRNDLLLAVFSLASFNCLMRYLEGDQIKFLLWNIFFFICALLTKETAVILPILFAACYLVYKKFQIKHLGFLLAGWLMLSAAFLFARNVIVEVPAPSGVGFIQVFKNFIPAMLLYIGKTIVPLQQSVLPLLRNASLIPGLLTFILLLVLFFKPGIHNKKIAGLGILIFIMILALPVWFSAAKNGAEHYEHRAYTAMAGLILFFSQLRIEYKSKKSQYFLALIFILFFIRTYSRMDIYKNKETFVDAGVKECEGNYLFLFQKSEFFFNQKNYDSAIVYCDRAIAIRADKPQMYSNRGTAHYIKGNYQNAIDDFTKSISLTPTIDYRYYLNRCFSYGAAGDHQSAMKDLQVLKKCCANVIPPELEKQITDNYAVMIENLSKQIEGSPDNDKLYFKRGSLYFDLGMDNQGMADLSKACTLAPDNKTYLQVYMSHYEKGINR